MNQPVTAGELSKIIDSMVELERNDPLRFTFFYIMFKMKKYTAPLVVVLVALFLFGSYLSAVYGLVILWVPTLIGIIIGLVIAGLVYVNHK
jgi:hypothetical protein